MEKFCVTYFDGAEVTLHLKEDTSDVRNILRKFSELGAQDRLKDSRHVFAYYRDFHVATDGEEWLDEEIGVPAGPRDIWRFVTPGPVWVERGLDQDTALYVVMEAECAWEEEHGLMMVWKNGECLTKVGGFDGHVTNSNAKSDDGLQGVVHFSHDERYLTRLW